MIEIETATETELLEFFKALAEPMRLRIAGRLAERPHSAQALAAALDERLPAVQRHLDYLAHAGLVAAPAERSDAYRLRLDAIHALAGQLLAYPAALVPEDVDDTFERKVLKDFLTPTGSLKEIPMNGRKLQVILRYLAPAIEPGRRYTEKEINAILGWYHPDRASLRRYLVDFEFMQRDPAGTAYWRTEVAAG